MVKKQDLNGARKILTIFNLQNMENLNKKLKEVEHAHSMYLMK